MHVPSMIAVFGVVGGLTSAMNVNAGDVNALARRQEESESATATSTAETTAISTGEITATATSEDTATATSEETAMTTAESTGTATSEDTATATEEEEEEETEEVMSEEEKLDLVSQLCGSGSTTWRCPFDGPCSTNQGACFNGLTAPGGECGQEPLRYNCADGFTCGEHFADCVPGDEARASISSAAGMMAASITGGTFTPSATSGSDASSTATSASTSGSANAASTSPSSTASATASSSTNAAVRVTGSVGGFLGLLIAGLSWL